MRCHPVRLQMRFPHSALRVAGAVHRASSRGTTLRDTPGQARGECKQQEGQRDVEAETDEGPSSSGQGRDRPGPEGRAGFPEHRAVFHTRPGSDTAGVRASHPPGARGWLTSSLPGLNHEEQLGTAQDSSAPLLTVSGSLPCAALRKGLLSPAPH